jgi:cellulose synthase/poly-beta-1,6-N-acetylglucosamine synthase-like glycosyltransferase
LGIVVYSYLFYPIALQILNWVFEIKPSPVIKEEALASVSLIIAVYNEEDVLEEKLTNCLEIDYPSDRLEILIGSDASDDGTVKILNRFSQHPIFRIFEFQKRRGKAGVLNRLAKEANGDVLIFCDANTMLLKNAVKKIAGNFGDPKTGAVCGRVSFPRILEMPTGSTAHSARATY